MHATQSHSASDPSTSTSLLGRACEGEAVAWQQIVQVYGPLVYNWARRTGLKPVDAADVTQDTFTTVSSRLASFDSRRQGATFRGWLWTITRNKAADHVRALRQLPTPAGGSANLAALNQLQANQVVHAVAQDELSCEASDHDKNEVIARAMALMRNRFEKSTWQAFWRTVVDGVSPDEVAEELGLSRWAVYKARSRVLQLLRSELACLEDLP